MRSDFGRTLRAIRTDQTAALALGIDVPRYKLYAFLIGAAFASIAGSLYAFDFQFLSPDMVSTQQSFLIVTMLVIGGEATLVGPVIGVDPADADPDVLPELAELQDAGLGHLARGRAAVSPERPVRRFHCGCSNGCSGGRRPAREPRALEREVNGEEALIVAGRDEVVRRRARDRDVSFTCERVR